MLDAISLTVLSFSEMLQLREWLLAASSVWKAFSCINLLVGMLYSAVNDRRGWFVFLSCGSVLASFRVTSLLNCLLLTLVTAIVLRLLLGCKRASITAFCVRYMTWISDGRCVIPRWNRFSPFRVPRYTASTLLSKSSWTHLGRSRREFWCTVIGIRSSGGANLTTGKVCAG